MAVLAHKLPAEPTPAPAPAPVPASHPVRAVIVGAAIGAVLAAGNVYAGLKTGYIDGGSITAALLGSLLIGLWTRRPAHPLDLNLTQTVAASAAVMSFAAGVAAPIPALGLLGHGLSGAVIFAWGLGAGTIGIVLAWALRPRLVVSDGLPFPSGQATAEIITALSARTGGTERRVLSLGLAALTAGIVTYLRDGRFALIPGTWTFPGTFFAGIFGVGAAALGLGISMSPLLGATGILVGPRIGICMALGAAIAWGGIAPIALAQHLAAEASYPALVSILLWPGLALMVSSAFVSLACSLPTLRRSLRDLSSLWAVRAGHGGDKLLVAMAGVGFLLVGCVAAAYFDLGPALLFGLLPVALILSAASARAAGETDQAPVGQVGSLAQVALSGFGVIASLGAGALVGGIATQTAQTLWAFKAGHKLGDTNPRRQLIAQLCGALVGAAVVVPIYAVVRVAYRLGSEQMPAPAALAWKATSEAAHGPLALAAPLVWKVTLAAAAFGVLASLLERRGHRFVPSPTALGAAFLLPASMSASICVGALLFACLHWRRPAFAKTHGPTLAAGAIAGESLVGLALAAIAALAIR